MNKALFCLVVLLVCDAAGCNRQPPVPPNHKLLAAVEQADVPAIHAAIKEGADPNVAVAGPNNYPLFLAAKTGNLELAKLLIEQGAKANHPGAVSPGDLSTFKHGIPLNAAAGALNLPMVQLLIEHGADVNAELENAGGINSPLQAAIGATQPRSLDPPVPAEKRQAAVDIVKLLIEKGAKPTRPTYGEVLPPLHWAADSGDLPLAQWLVEHGYDVKSTTWNNYSVLYYAASGGNVELIQWVLAQNVDLETTNENGWSPLYFAVTRGRSEAVKYLLEEAGCNVNGSQDPKTTYAGTPLHLAVMVNKLEIARQLIDAGADLSLRNKFGQTPLGAAREQLEKQGLTNRQEIVDFLKAQNAPE